MFPIYRAHVPLETELYIAWYHLSAARRPCQRGAAEYGRRLVFHAAEDILIRSSPPGIAALCASLLGSVLRE